MRTTPVLRGEHQHAILITRRISGLLPQPCFIVFISTPVLYASRLSPLSPRVQRHVFTISVPRQLYVSLFIAVSFSAPGRLRLERLCARKRVARPDTRCAAALYCIVGEVTPRRMTAYALFVAMRIIKSVVAVILSPAEPGAIARH